MIYVLGRMAAVIAIGILWRIKPIQIGAGALQRALMALIYTVLLPAMVLMVLWKAPMNTNMVHHIIVTAGSTAAALAAAWFLMRKQGWSPATKGALLLAAAFSNVIFLGIPVSQTLVADWTIRTAIEFEVFAIVPLLFTIGVMLATSTEHHKAQPAFVELFKQPIVWAAIAGILFNLSDTKMPWWLSKWLVLLTSGMTPLLLIAVGLSLQWRTQWSKLAPQLMIVVAIQLGVVPLAVWLLANIVDLNGLQTFRSLMLQAAMPSAMLGFVVCERYKLDMSVYTAAFTATTVLACITVPLWYNAMKSGLIGL